MNTRARTSSRSRLLLPVLATMLIMCGRLSYPAILHPKTVQTGERRQYDGKPLSVAQQMKMDVIINCLAMFGKIKKTVGGTQMTFDMERAADCLRKMLHPTERGRQPRICLEAGTTTSLAGTLSGRNVPGECDPTIARMNIKEEILYGTKERAVGVLAHEWLHTPQADGLEGAAAAQLEADANWLQIETTRTPRWL